MDELTTLLPNLDGEKRLKAEVELRSLRVRNLQKRLRAEVSCTVKCALVFTVNILLRRGKNEQNSLAL